MKRYSVERIKALLEELHEFDSHDLKDIELLEDGEPLVIPADVWDFWRFSGLCNRHFVEGELWKAEIVSQTL